MKISLPPLARRHRIFSSGDGLLHDERPRCVILQGPLQPFRDSMCRSSGKKAGTATTTTTLREELLAGKEEDEDIFDVKLRPPRGGSSTFTTRLKGLLDLRKSPDGSKKVEPKTNVRAQDAAHRNPASQIH
ncbi:hypothetical protein SAY87_002222 [Trapa incisa]|uniref:Uncharacterized protein n=1 Tax=Trapa incisa TaxID=236973 RepID=A0AAN7JZD7_9MYRT|nr:hypothetical protein SAY87_002222 [Trapa incisa]